MPKGIYERKPRPAVERFWEKVDKTGDCWEWLASKRNGYGRFRMPKKEWKAPRFSWMIHNGSIPEGLCVCHTCDNPSCVNPAHLFLGTHKENMYDSIKKGRSKLPPCLKGEAHGSSILTDEQVFAIRKEYKTGRITQRELAIKYNVSQTTIWMIVNRKYWKHI